MILSSSISVSVDGSTAFNSIIELLVNFVTVGGALWLVWGVIILGTALKDKNGPALQSGVWQIVGGGLIVAAAAFFSTLISVS